MKYSSIAFVALALCLASCSDNEEPRTEVNLPITRQYLPDAVIFDLSDRDFMNKVKPFVHTKFIVNSVDEIPDDPFGFNESCYQIDFSNNTLLIYYDLSLYNILSCQNRYFKSPVDGTYNWSILLGVSGKLDGDEDIERAVVCRYKLLVPKLRDDVNLRVSAGLSDVNWDRGEQSLGL